MGDGGGYFKAAIPAIAFYGGYNAFSFNNSCKHFTNFGKLIFPFSYFRNPRIFAALKSIKGGIKLC
jgi:hypothetical protein